MRRHLHAFQILANVRRAGMKKACTSHSLHICIHIVPCGVKGRCALQAVDMQVSEQLTSLFHQPF